VVQTEGRPTPVFPDYAAAMKKRIRILFFHRTLRQSGAARQIYLLYQQVDRTLFEPSLVVQTDKKLYFARAPQTEPLIVLSSSELRPFAAVRKFSEIIQSEKPDIIQSFNTDGNLLAYMATRGSHVPCLVGSLRNTRKSWVEILIERRISKAYSVVVVNSRATRDELIQRIAINTQRIELIHNGVDTGFFRPIALNRKAELRRQHNIPADAFVVISVGRISRQKNHACTLRALARFRGRTASRIPVHWYCLGLQEHASLYRQLRQLSVDLHIDMNCHFIESVVDISEYYAMADVSVLSSFWEGMPNALLESMACECLAIVADTADNDAIVDNGKNGFLFPVDDHIALAGLLESVMAMPYEHKRRIEQNARLAVLQRYSTSSMVQQYQLMYQRCLAASNV